MDVFMLMQFAPSNWFFIFMAFLLASYLKIASAKSQKPVFLSVSISQILK